MKKGDVVKIKRTKWALLSKKGGAWLVINSKGDLDIREEKELLAIIAKERRG